MYKSMKSVLHVYLARFTSIVVSDLTCRLPVLKSLGEIMSTASSIEEAGLPSLQLKLSSSYYSYMIIRFDLATNG